MRALLWIFRLIVFILLLGFSTMNTEPVSLHFFFGLQWQAPLVIIVLGFFAVGALLGVIALLGTLFHLRRELSRVRRDLQLERERQTVAPAAVIDGPVSPPAAGEAVAQ